MDPTTLDLMHEQVRAIYAALTGGQEMREPKEPLVGTGGGADLETVARRFADLEAIARTIPAVAERIPPFSFSPPVDVIDEEDGLLVEFAVPSVSEEDVKVEFSDNQLIVHGVRHGERTNGRVYRHAEIPRGPFRRVVLLPYALSEAPELEVDRGVIRIHVPKPPNAVAGAKPGRDRVSFETTPTRGRKKGERP